MSQRSDIPAARTILREARTILTRMPRPTDIVIAVSKIDDALAKMTRARWKTNAPAKSDRMSPKRAQAIKAFQRANPGLSQQEIGMRFNVSAGRVSEALNGMWDPGGEKWLAYRRKYGERDDG